jgi:DNA-directed RNA polymerase specialized sigma24 family protein
MMHLVDTLKAGKAWVKSIICRACCDQCRRVQAHNNMLSVKIDMLHAELDEVRRDKG